MKAESIAISYKYDELNRLFAAIYGDGKAVYYSYDAAGNLISVLPELEDSFTGMEKEYKTLKGRLGAGSLTAEEFQEAVNALRLQDSGGAWWQLRYDGAWLKWEGAAWVEAAPGA